MITSSTATVASATNQSLVSTELWSRLVNRVTKNLEFQQFFGDQDETTQRDWAERIMEQTLGFLKVSAMTADGTLSPSTNVDIGWHTFLIYTREYSDFC